MYEMLTVFFFISYQSGSFARIFKCQLFYTLLISLKSHLFNKPKKNIKKSVQTLKSILQVMSLEKSVLTNYTSMSLDERYENVSACIESLEQSLDILVNRYLLTIFLKRKKLCF